MEVCSPEKQLFHELVNREINTVCMAKEKGSEEIQNRLKTTKKNT